MKRETAITIALAAVAAAAVATILFAAPPACTTTKGDDCRAVPTQPAATDDSADL